MFSHGRTLTNLKGKKMNKKEQILNFEITTEECIDYQNLSELTDHDYYCAYRCSKGTESFLESCECSPRHVRTFLQGKKNEHKTERAV